MWRQPDGLHPVYDRLTEGFDTADLEAAKTLFVALQCPGSAGAYSRGWTRTR
jgi:hypothetical protein